jgi:hypothetical protein
MSFIADHWWLWLAVFVAAYASVFVYHARFLKRGLSMERVRKANSFYSAAAVLALAAGGLTAIAVVLKVIDYAKR